MDKISDTLNSVSRSGLDQSFGLFLGNLDWSSDLPNLADCNRNC